MSAETPSILVVDDDIVAASLLSEVLTREGYSVDVAASGKEAVAAGAGRAYDLVITDIKMPGMSGLDLLEHFRREHPQTYVFVITAFGSFDTAVGSIKKGAYDYLTKPFKMDEIKSKVARCLEQKALSNFAASPSNSGVLPVRTLVGRSPKMLETYKMVARVAGSDVPVLILGESGTGKELISKAVHDNSKRADGPYVAVNCTTLPENLLESELFGHVKGAFTSALAEKKGLFEEATGGTVFLDEIGEMPFTLQAKLLRALQTNEIRRVGGSQNIAIDVRFIAATNRDLASMVNEGRFREDLYYRLHVVTINLPALREHAEDIPLLVDHFFRRAVIRSGKEIQGISKETMALLTGYEWPGNIRQLENVIERAVALTSNSVLLPTDIPDELRGGQGHRAKPFFGGKLPTFEELKLSYIDQVLEHTGGNQIMAAEILGIDRKTLYRILKKNRKV